jgi:hypothetical protein
MAFLEIPVVLFCEKEANDVLFVLYQELPDFEAVLYEQTLAGRFSLFKKLPVFLRDMVLSSH